jgi:hypothetical protein
LIADPAPMASITKPGPNDIMTGPGPPWSLAVSPASHDNTAASPAPEISPDENAEAARSSAIQADIPEPFFKLTSRDEESRISPTSATQAVLTGRQGQGRTN